MAIRNAGWNAFGTVDLEYRHPQFGWIPFTASPDDVEELGRALYAEALDGEIASYVAPPEPPPQVPVEISDRQFFQALAMQGIITQADALGAVKTGTLPAAMQAMIDALPADQRFGATMLLSGATVFRLDHPLVATFAAAFGWDGPNLDAFWTFAAAL